MHHNYLLMRRQHSYAVCGAALAANYHNTLTSLSDMSFCFEDCNSCISVDNFASLIKIEVG